MSKRSIGTRVDAEVYKRLEDLAAVDRRSVANILDLLIERGLPDLETEILTTTAAAARARKRNEIQAAKQKAS